MVSHGSRRISSHCVERRISIHYPLERYERVQSVFGHAHLLLIPILLEFKTKS